MLKSILCFCFAFSAAGFNINIPWYFTAEHYSNPVKRPSTRKPLQDVCVWTRPFLLPLVDLMGWHDDSLREFCRTAWYTSGFSWFQDLLNSELLALSDVCAMVFHLFFSDCIFLRLYLNSNRSSPILWFTCWFILFNTKTMWVNRLSRGDTSNQLAVMCLSESMWPWVVQLVAGGYLYPFVNSLCCCLLKETMWKELCLWTVRTKNIHLGQICFLLVISHNN